MKTTHTLRRILSVWREWDLFERALVGGIVIAVALAVAVPSPSVAVVLASMALCLLTGFALGRRH